MPPFNCVHYLLFGLVMALLVGGLSVSKFGMQILGVLVGFVFALLGLQGLVSGRMEQRYHAAPALEGPVARIEGLLILAFGLYMIYAVVSDKRDDKNPRE